MVEGGEDKLKPKGWAAEIAAEVPDGRSIIVDSGRPLSTDRAARSVHQLLLEFLSGGEPS